MTELKTLVGETMSIEKLNDTMVRKGLCNENDIIYNDFTCKQILEDGIIYFAKDENGNEHIKVDFRTVDLVENTDEDMMCQSKICIAAITEEKGE